MPERRAQTPVPNTSAVNVAVCNDERSGARLANFHVDEVAMPMELISQSVSRLQSRKEAIKQELADIDSRFRAIAQALKVDGASDISEPKPAASDGGKADGATNKGRKSNRWFAPGEAASLMKRYVRTPIVDPRPETRLQPHWYKNLGAREPQGPPEIGPGAPEGASGDEPPKKRMWGL